MHEEALLRDLRRKLAEISDRERPSRISRVVLWVGALAHVTEATLRSAWTRTTDGTGAEGATLEVEVSNDPENPRAQGIVLARVDLTDRTDAERARAGSAGDPQPHLPASSASPEQG
jgi:hydrogenase nickel incorporation protein HypA/HybF